MLDRTSYPHIFDLILTHLDWKGLKAMRATNSVLNDRLCAEIYRHVVIWIRTPPRMPPITSAEILEPQPLLIVDPYLHKPLLLLDLSAPLSGSLPTVNPYSKGLASLTFSEALGRLLRHTRVLDVHGDGLGFSQATHDFMKEFHKDLQPLLQRVDFVRETNPLIRWVRSDQTPHPYRTTMFVSVGTPLSPASAYCGKHAYTSNLFKQRDEFVVLVTLDDRLEFPPPPPSRPSWDPYGVLSIFCWQLNSRFTNAVYTKMTFVTIKSSGTGASAAEWDDFLAQLASAWEFHPRRREPDGSPSPITFSPKTIEEFQRDSGMSDYEFELFSTHCLVRRCLTPRRGLSMLRCM